MPDSGGASTDDPSSHEAAVRAAVRATLAELAKDPRPSVSRAALAAQYPSWGLATLSLLAIGLLVGFASLSPLGMAIDACPSDPGLVVCQPKAHAVVVALPTAALLVGLAVSLIGGRLLTRLGRSPLLASGVGWAVFLLGTVVAYRLAGVL
ncbi:MAG TPA: hypothetical protein VGD73_21350 [Pseudonocardia sp.]|jgi:hypothetical protein|uniref:hypothetical protein n=1 Tax=Pseudonocardia sp. TaxID=60912 RepID=UPI002ED79074